MTTIAAIHGSVRPDMDGPRLAPRPRSLAGEGLAIDAWWNLSELGFIGLLDWQDYRQSEPIPELS